MPSKTTKRARRAGAKPSNAPVAKDDGTRWLVVRHGEPVYGFTGGLIRGEAERLATGLLEPAQLRQISLPS